LEQLTGPAAVVNVMARAAANPDYEITIGDLTNWESHHGRLDGVIVLLRTGHSRYWPDPARYLGTSQRGAEAVKQLHFPGLHPDAARWLAAERRVRAVGIDTASIDYGQSQRFESHRALFAQNVPVFENVAALDQLPATGSFVVALPMKIQGGSGATLRIVAWVP
jgi:kynurenine formamidase